MGMNYWSVGAGAAPKYANGWNQAMTEMSQVKQNQSAALIANDIFRIFVRNGENPGESAGLFYGDGAAGTAGQNGGSGGLFMGSGGSGGAASAAGANGGSGGDGGFIGNGGAGGSGASSTAEGDTAAGNGGNGGSGGPVSYTHLTLPTTPYV